MHSTTDCCSAEAWLVWFETTQVTSCRAYLCATYGLEAADADAFINTARWQVYRYWVTIENPLAYFWQTLRRAVHALRRQLRREQQQQEAYIVCWREHTQLATRITQQVADVLEGTAPRERQLLQWFAQGYDDTQVAAWLKTTPAAVRVRRHAAYRTLRASIASPPAPYQRAKQAASPTRQGGFH